MPRYEVRRGFGLSPGRDAMPGDVLRSPEDISQERATMHWRTGKLILLADEPGAAPAPPATNPATTANSPALIRSGPGRRAKEKKR